MSFVEILYSGMLEFGTKLRKKNFLLFRIDGYDVVR